ncbi:MAG: chromate transporter [Candidatus Pelethousia sp.]|nr:chromate transporter [Candidatus Pelethousia sp.]
MEKSRTSLPALFWAFARVGALTFGGGYAMLPMLERECTEAHGWVTQEELLDCFAISQCTPGVIAVNTATFVGAKERGPLGAAAATLGVASPSILLILIVATLLDQFAHIPAVQHAFGGIRVAVAVLIVNSVVRLYKSNVKDGLGIILCIAAFLLIAVFSFSPVYVVVGAAVVGILAARRRA